ncbi:MAG: tetratricopeptide (TPR) repeat protein [Paraglaciecola sp.]|jgi:tetratricopeptide (TPR) repeat protein
MKQSSTLSVLSLILLAFMACPAVGQQLQWQLVLLEKPAIAIPPEHLVAYKKSEEALASQLISGEYEIADKSLLDITGNAADEQIYALVKKGINLALRYQIDISTEAEVVVKKWRFNLSAYVVDLESKKQIETAALVGIYSDVPNKCDEQCFSQWLATRAAGLAQDLGAIFVQKLNNLPKRYQYELEFYGFVGNELEQVRQYLKHVEGYVFAELKEKLDSRAQLFHQLEGARYGYVSNLTPDELDGALFRQLRQLGIPVLQAKNHGKKLIFTRSSMPYLWVYIAAGILILLAVYMIYVLLVLSKHNTALDKLAHHKHAQQWLDYANGLALIGIPRPASWHRQEKSLVEDVNQSNSMSEQAWLLADQGDYVAAQLKVAEALQMNADNTNAIELKDNIVNYQRGQDRYVLAKKEWQSHPEQAAKLLQEAAELTPHLSEKISRLSKQNSRSIHMADAHAALVQAQAAFDSKQYYLAYSLIDGVLSEFNLDVSSSEFVQLAALRGTIDAVCPPLTGTCVATGMLSGYAFYPCVQLECGRKPGDEHSSFGVGFKRNSRSGKQNAFIRQGRDFFVIDQGSSNGSYYGDQRLQTEQLVRVQDNNLLCTGSSPDTDSKGICQIKTQLAKQGSNALVLRLNATVFQFVDDTNINLAWPTIAEDLVKRWVMMGDVVHIGVDSHSDLDVGCVNDSASVAKLIYDNGFYIAPGLSVTEGQNIRVNGHLLQGRVPVSAQQTITISGQSFSMQGI